MQKRKTIVIIGAGVAGLSAGIYAEQHGFHAILLEKNPSVGGMCTGWYRKGYYLDGCVHWLTGTKEGTLLNEMWKNLDVFKSQDDILYLPSWGTYEYQGHKVTMWTDLDRAEREWKELSPVDGKMIHKFFKMVHDFTKVELPLDLPLSMMPLKRKLKLGIDVLKVWPSYLLTMGQSCEKFANKFKHPTIRFALKKCQIGEGNLFSMIYSYATIVNGDGGIPVGGSKPMVERMKEKFLSLGGTLKLNANVESVVIREDAARGVKLSNGQIVEGDAVVSCLDANYTLKKLLRDQYPLPSFERRFKNPKLNNSPSCMLLSFSVKEDNGLPIPYSFETEPFEAGGIMIDHITVRSYSYDKTFSRNGRTVMTVMVDQSNKEYPFWSQLSKDRAKYNEYKNNIAHQVMERVGEHFPQLKGDIELLDIATPYTFKRYVNTSNGVYMSFFFTTRGGMYTHSGHLKGLKDFYLSGQWLQGPGGLPIAMTQGKFAIQRICKKENLSFVFSPLPKHKKAKPYRAETKI